MEDDERICFVCLDDEDPNAVKKCPCRCTNRFVHLHCMVRCVEASGRSTRCAVCNYEISGLRYTETRNRHRDFSLMLATTSLIVWVGLTGFCIYLLIKDMKDERLARFVWTTIGFTFASVGAVAASLVLVEVHRLPRVASRRLVVSDYWKEDELDVRMQVV